ncbi:hypothetical protein [Nitrincola sp. A-D6]|uniref:hypothetical protein n=1 Tax=Nitrincola sp. A-D6 TaxID=1545442 RepID=UPI0011866D25|nr:hypothetical protein [Nitrincola sp. A-D6]
MSKIYSFFLYFSYYLLIVILYNYSLYDLYSYKGAEKIINLELRVIFCIFFSILSATITPKLLRKPGDYLVFILTIGLIPTVVILNGVSRYSNVDFEYILIVFLTMTALAIFNSVDNLKNNYLSFKINKSIVVIIGALNIIAIILVLYKTQSYFSLSYDGYHIRRILSKDIFQPGKLESYYVSIFLQGMFPVIFVFSMVEKNRFLIYVSLASIIVLWGAFGERYTVVLAIFLYLIIFFHKKNNGKGVGSIYILLVLIGILCTGILEKYLFDSIYINDHLLRRIYAVPAIINDAYIQYAKSIGFNEYCDTKLYIFHCIDRTINVAYLVSQKIINDPDMNANTNFITYSFVNAGFFGVFIEVAIVGAIVVICNYVFIKETNYFIFSVCLLMALKIIEKSLPISLISSGILLIMAISYLSYRKRTR